MALSMKVRAFAIAAFFVFLVAASGGVARAITEYCPAQVSAIRAYGNPNPDAPSQLFGYRLVAAGARNVSGHIILKTKSGWFILPFGNVELSPYEEHWQTPSAEFRRRNFVSSPLYGRFSEPQSIVDAYVGDAATIGDRSFGWDQKGAVTCSAPAGFSVPRPKESKPSAFVLLNPLTDLAAPPPANARIALAALTNVPGPLDCKEPFTEAKVAQPMQPPYPTMAEEMGVGGSVLVKVAIDENGAPSDAWIWTPSGNKAIDEAALSAAQRSTYEVGTAFCNTAPGLYLFRADFVP